MKSAICQWIRKVCKKYKLSAYYFPPNDAYLIHYKGNIITAFYGNQFYDLSPTVREKGIRGNFAGLEINIGEKTNQNQTKTNYHNGKLIYKS